MPALANVLFCAGCAAVFFYFIGLQLACLIVRERTIQWAIAPTLGWAVFTTVAFLATLTVSFSRLSVAIITIGVLATAALAAGRSWRRSEIAGLIKPGIPIWGVGLAGLLAVIPAIAVVPKFAIDGIVLSPKMYDHSKIAIVNDIVRLGLPAGNPFFGNADSHLVYYYLWHFGAAFSSKLLGVTGWETDIAFTWFTAFAALILMMGLAVHFTGRGIASLWVSLLSTSLSLRPVLSAVLSQTANDSLLTFDTPLQGWMVQATWSPQHLAGATCVVVAIVLMHQLANDPSRLLGLILAIVIAAGFGSSVWVGGIAFVIAAFPVALILYSQAGASHRRLFFIRLASVAVLVVLLAFPFIRDEYLATLTRHAGPPVAFRFHEVLGSFVASPLRKILDVPAYWLVLLIVEFPAIYLLGSFALIRSLTADTRQAVDRTRIIVLAATALACFTITWLLASTIMNNDLGWRALLPGALILTIFAAIGLTRWIAKPFSVIHAMALIPLALGLPDGLMLITSSATGEHTSSSSAFADTMVLWQAVRAHSGPAERIANNPAFLSNMVGAPINISWALFADRRSCYAQLNFALAFVPLPAERIAQIDALFQRVFAGTASPEEISDLPKTYNCRLIVITPDDGAWANDIFAINPHYRLVDEKTNRWRLYRPTDPSPHAS